MRPGAEATEPGGPEDDLAMATDMSGKVVLVTGATGGIGKETARALAGRGAMVVASGRNRERLEAAAADLRSDRPDGSVETLLMDVASLESTRSAAAEVLERWDRLDILINNAGVVLSSRQVSSDGLEMTMATNHFGHFLLTQLLVERMKASTPARIVNVSSTAHRGARSVGLDDLQSERSYSAMGAYNRSKLANILFTRELARRLEGTGVSAFSVHPGVVRTGWGRSGDTHGVLNVFLSMALPLQITPRMGAGATLYAATQPGIEVDSGSFYQRTIFGNFGPVRRTQPSAPARDDIMATRLWEESALLVGGA
jgi:retinol dehydrogenase 12